MRVYKNNDCIEEIITTAVVADTQCETTLTLPAVSTWYQYEDCDQTDEAWSCTGKVLTVVNDSCHCVEVVPSEGFKFHRGDCSVAVSEGQSAKFYNKDHVWYVAH